MTDLLLIFSAGVFGAFAGVFAVGWGLRQHHKREDARHRDRARRLADLAAARDRAIIAAGDAATDGILCQSGVDPLYLRRARLARDAANAAYHAACREGT